MHTLLEAYLDQVAAHLSALPPKRHTEELREMRQHLLNAVTVNQELGQSEEDAAANAIMQFGTAEDLGDNLVWAWRREQLLNKKSLVGAVTCTSALLFTMPAAVAMLLLPIYSRIGLFHGTSQWNRVALYALGFLVYDLPAYALIGTVIRRLFSRRAVLGISLVVGAYTVFDIILHPYWGQWIYSPGHLRYVYLDGPHPFTAEDTVRVVMTNAVLALIAVASASTTRRRWMKRTARKRLARG